MGVQNADVRRIVSAEIKHCASASRNCAKRTKGLGLWTTTLGCPRSSNCAAVAWVGKWCSHLSGLNAAEHCVVSRCIADEGTEGEGRGVVRHLDYRPVNLEVILNHTHFPNVGNLAVREGQAVAEEE